MLIVYEPYWFYNVRNDVFVFYLLDRLIIACSFSKARLTVLIDNYCLFSREKVIDIPVSLCYLGLPNTW